MKNSIVYETKESSGFRNDLSIFDNTNLHANYIIDLKIVSFPCERDFYFFGVIRLVIFVEPFNSSQKARIHTFSSSKS